jgi:purine-nucleoside phosphorylase
MSTVPEVITARARGMRCLGFSTITNLAAGISPNPLSHHEVLEVGRQVGQSLGSIVKGVVRRLPG